MRVDPKSLVKKLDPLCRHALAGGVGLAVARSHYEVTVEHGPPPGPRSAKP